MRYFDSHAHYYDARFESECESSVDTLIDALLSDSVSGIINVGTSVETSRLAIEQASRHEGMYTALGIHPSDSQYIDMPLDAAMHEIEIMLRDKNSKAVALGEIGLDYHYEDTNKDIQMQYFHAGMTLARELDIPVSIHDRDSHGDIMEVIRQYKGARGVLHSFSGSVEMARELVSLGYMISFSGTLTFTNAKKPREVASVIPKEFMLIETDCPYLAPHPRRGTLNHSGNLVYTNSVLAGVLGISEEECALLTDENARRFFNIR